MARRVPVKLLGMHDDTGCGYYRIRLPLDQLAAHGHEVKRVLGADANWSTCSDWPLIVGQRIDKRDALPTWRRLAARSKLVYEIDDDVFSVDPVNWQAYGVYSRAGTRDAVAHAAEVANLVTVTCEPLADVMSRFNKNVEILPNFIPEFVCDLPSPAGERPAVGWAGGASHALDIAEIAGPLRTFLDRHDGWDGVLIGTDYRPSIKHHRCGYVPWTKITEDAEGYYRSLDFDIGLAPLATATRTFNASKSHLKCLEYAARGIPVIASDQEPYRHFVLHGVTGFLVKRDHEWLKYLEELTDPELRTAMGAKAKEHARGFTIEGNWQLWEQAYGSL